MVDDATLLGVIAVVGYGVFFLLRPLSNRSERVATYLKGHVVFVALAVTGGIGEVLSLPRFLNIVTSIASFCLLSVGAWLVSGWLLAATGQLLTDDGRMSTKERLEADREYARQQRDTATQTNPQPGHMISGSDSLSETFPSGTGHASDEKADQESGAENASADETEDDREERQHEENEEQTPYIVGEGEYDESVLYNVTGPRDETVFKMTYVCDFSEVDGLQDMAAAMMDDDAVMPVGAPDVSKTTMPIDAQRDWDIDDLSGVLGRKVIGPRHDPPFGNTGPIGYAIAMMECSCGADEMMAMNYLDVEGEDREKIAGVWHGHTLETIWTCLECDQHSRVYISDDVKGYQHVKGNFYLKSP